MPQDTYILTLAGKNSPEISQNISDCFTKWALPGDHLYTWKDENEVIINIRTHKEVEIAEISNLGLRFARLVKVQLTPELIWSIHFFTTKEHEEHKVRCLIADMLSESRS